MLLGQLYYYEKKIESVKFLVENNEVEKVEIIGVETSLLKSLKDLPSKEVYPKLLVAFSQKYSEILEQESLFSALNTWKLVTSPYKSTYQSSKNSIYEKVSLWLDGSSEYETITQLLDDIGFTQEDEEFAVVYGLIVLQTLLGSDSLGVRQKATDFEYKQINPDQEPKIIVVCPLSLSPLMTNLNCIFIDTQLDQSQIISKISEYVSESPLISLVLVEEDKWEELSVLLSRRLERPPLVAPLNLGLEDNSGYFDNLVKKTLGVRLV
jgi:hypothetical protein